jgi:hypothetical protein
LVCVLSAQTTLRGSSYNTFPAWDGVTNLGYFGSLSATPANTPTFGETFVAPVGTTVLNNFTFEFGSTSGLQTDDAGNYLPDAVGDQYTVQGEVYNWTGSLYGNNGPQGTTGAALYTSQSFTITTNGSFQAVTVSIAGGLNLQAGNDYVVDLNDLSQSNPNDFGIFGLLPNFSHDPGADGGGGFNFSNVGSSGIWDDGVADLGDLAFSANFSSPSNNNVPDTASTVVLLGAGMAALALVPRRRLQAVRS